MFFFSRRIEQLKKITKDVYNKYVINLNKVEDKENDYNYLGKDVIAFIKKFIENHQVYLDIDSLMQYINQDNDDFYN